MKKYNLNPVESVFIDDIQANLDTAAELGFETILSTSETENISAMEDLLAVKGIWLSHDYLLHLSLKSSESELQP